MVSRPSVVHASVCVSGQSSEQGIHLGMGDRAFLGKRQADRQGATETQHCVDDLLCTDGLTDLPVRLGGIDKSGHDCRGALGTIGPVRRLEQRVDDTQGAEPDVAIRSGC